MERHVTDIIHHMALSHVEMARIIEEQRHVASHVAQLIHLIPDQPSFNSTELITQHSILVTENITSYLNSIADLEEAIAENLSYVMKEITHSEEE